MDASQKLARLTLVAAVSVDGYISRSKGVPWELPRDRRHFREITSGKALLLARRTYEEMLGWFQRDHLPFVLTHDAPALQEPGRVVKTVLEAQKLAAEQGREEIFVCGGSAAYELAMPSADRMLITHVNVVLGSGVPFPAISEKQWRLVAVEEYPTDAENAHEMRFAEYQRM